jgi:hypothetical protein
MLALAIKNGGFMLVPPRKPGDNEYRISFDNPTSIGTMTLYAKNEVDAKKLFKTYVGKQPIRNIRKIS